jgi:hypothetical protein
MHPHRAERGCQRALHLCAYSNALQVQGSSQGFTGV